MRNKKVTGPPKARPGSVERSIDPCRLVLDSKNPRFAAYGSARRTEEAVIRYLLDTADLGELLSSIAANGYVDLEPLIALAETGKDALTVIEGNRRVAALKLLRRPHLAAKLGVSLPSMAPEFRPTLRSARVLVVDSRDAARQYIGFKHINGPHKWDSFAKGHFAAEWYRREKSGGVTLRDIAQRLGDRHDTILRLVNGIYVLDQARELGFFDIDDRPSGRPFFFSHLYTALTRSAYRSYLGLVPEWRHAEPMPNPVPASHHDRLKQILQWIYGSPADGLEPLVRSQNPHVRQLGEVLGAPIALKRLEATGDLQQAFAEVATRSRLFEENLIKAVQHAEEAQQVVDAYEHNAPLLKYGERLVKIGQGLVRAMSDASDVSRTEPDPGSPE